jgi:hypothetical protein
MYRRTAYLTVNSGSVEKLDPTSDLVEHGFKPCQPESCQDDYVRDDRAGMYTTRLFNTEVVDRT